MASISTSAPFGMSLPPKATRAGLTEPMKTLAYTSSLTSPWTIAENGKLPLSYDAVVSAVSQPVTEQDVLSVVFVLEWKGE